MTHTIGPWRIDHCNPGPTTGEWMIAGGKPGYLAEVRDCGSGDVCANARLIAAAPELLAALRLMLAQFADHEQYDEDGYDTEAINATRAAIAKATGDAA